MEPTIAAKRTGTKCRNRRPVLLRSSALMRVGYVRAYAFNYGAHKVGHQLLILASEPGSAPWSEPEPFTEEFRVMKTNGSQ